MKGLIKKLVFKFLAKRLGSSGAKAYHKPRKKKSGLSVLIKKLLD